jgi:hypothetical protein
MAEERIILGEEEGVNEDSIEFLPDVTFEDLLNAIDEQFLEGPADLLFIGKRVNSGKKNREVGGFVVHLEDILELDSFARKQNLDPKTDTLELVQKLCGLEELPEKIVGIVIRET